MLDIALEVEKEEQGVATPRQSFNPSYAGYCSGSGASGAGCWLNSCSTSVSILLMLDIALEVSRQSRRGKGRKVSILLMLDIALEGL